MPRKTLGMLPLVALLYPAQCSLADCERHWQGMLHLPGLSGAVRCASVMDNDIYLGGEFRVGGMTSSRGVIRHHNGAFESLDGGFDGTVAATIIYNGQLVAAGEFSRSGSTTGLFNIARWNGSIWQPLGFLNASVASLAVWQKSLIAAGHFTVSNTTIANSNIARFNGSTWAPLSPAANGVVLTMTPLQDSLIVGGEFASIGSVPARRIARIDAAGAVSRMGSGVDATVHQLAVINSQLVAVGDFTSSGLDTVNRIAAWNGTNWSQFGDGIEGPTYAIAQSQGVIYASAAQSLADPVGVTYALTNNHWTPVQVSDTPPTVLIDAPEGLLAAGEFQTFGGTSAFRASLIVDGTARPLCPGTNGSIHAFVKYHDQLIISGDFTVVEGVPANHIAAWDGVQWHALAGGLDAGAESTCVWHDELFVAGPFRFADGRRVNYIARWDGSTWRDCAGGANDQIRSMRVFQDELYVGGDFDILGSVWCHHLARWDGGNWVAMIGPNSLGTDNNVTAMAACDQALIVGGAFTRIGGVPARSVASFNGVSFAQIAEGLSQAPVSLEAFDHPELPLGFSAYAFGAFVGTLTDGFRQFIEVGINAANPTRWAGIVERLAQTAHFRMYNPLTYGMYSVTPFTGASYLLSTSGGSQFVDGRVRAYLQEGSEIIVAGDFVSFNSSATPYLARYECSCRGDFNRDHIVDFFDYLDFVYAFAAGGGGADINLDWTVDFFDYLDFLEDFSTGC